ncbi:Hypothetical protein R9X50_00290200 [Acrodontium crateriforme]|uniref:F-box domain-containing protein n=1 Tax=Acrodontium crateriforme TaxID=150365 RepID=A0AAQ3M1W9_9PEZI|nr:Hypothetical protein R9X50_00290200 [Acrodontium crateriforme]
MDMDLQALDPSFEEIFKSDQDLTPFRLFDLPAELWLRVIDLAVTKSDSITITKGRSALDQVEIVRQPAITRTCRLLRQEALRMFYRHNDFEAMHFTGVACPRKWFVAIGKENLMAMHSFTFYAKFQSGFWMDKFREIGIKAEVERTPHGGMERRGSVYSKLMVKFCDGDVVPISS